MAACRDVFHLLAVEEEGDGWAGRLGATHPPLEQRIERLERMERALQLGAPGAAWAPSARRGASAATSQAFRLGSGSTGLPARVPAGRRPQLEVQVAGGGVAGAPDEADRLAGGDRVALVDEGGVAQVHVDVVGRCRRRR